jgi:phosphoglycerol transferase MdoB-like AlkP superfamily enzyme
LILKRLFQYLKIICLFLAVFEISRLYFVVYNASYFNRHVLQVFAETALHGFWLDLSSAAYCILPFTLLWLLEHIFRKKSPSWVPVLMVVTELLIIFLITLADAELFIQWGNKFNNQVLVYISHPLEMALSAGSANWLKSIGFALPVIGLFYITGRLISKIASDPVPLDFKGSIVPLLLTGVSFVAVRGGVGVTTISQSSAIYSDKSAENAASINSLWNAVYYVINNTDNIYGKSYLYTDAETAKKSFGEQIGQDSASFILSDNKRPNIMIVMLESFTASASNYFSGYNNCTPYLDSLARKSLSFTHCYASGDRTEKGLVSVISGYPAQPASSIIVFPDKMEKLPSISRMLKPLGYQNTFIYGGDAEFAAMKSYLLLHGFNHVIDKKDFSKQQLNSKWGAHDGYLYEKTLETLAQQKEPFFTVLLSLSSHEPFDVPYESPDLPRDGWYNYKNSLRYADYCLYNFIKSCEKQPWYDETIIILVADHGHDIGLENIFYFGKEKYHIPLLVTGGALDKKYIGARISQVISQTIIPNLLLQNAGLPTSDFNWQTGISHPAGFAQYHYNNGFGRVSSQAEAVSDNAYHSYYFRGNAQDSLKLKHDGKIFQQILINDFLKK